ncbi:MAG: GTPase Era [Bacteroidales bacterium]|nr:GTPase Era [Bacteroidales bacterium]MBN2758677.1 GTPase Era [Bacteroidales bacterium]
MENHKAGFVNIVGNPNVGKSTLMNALVGEKLSIITSKSQTTRHRIMGIVNGEDFQIVYSDTPGVVQPASKLHESMLKFSKSALEDADVIIYVTDIYEKTDKNIDFIEKTKNTGIPVLLIINKVDLSNQEKLVELTESWEKIMPDAYIIPTSATENFNIDILLRKIIELLPVSPPFFPKDQLTDKTERFFVSEIIREKILMNYKKEIPYSAEVEVEEFKEEEHIIKIRAIINVERESQKGIIIGNKGAALKKTGTMARIDIEAFFEKKVYLELYVKVSKDWKNKPKSLKQFGYN